MKLSPVLFFLPPTLALPSFHSLGNVDISIRIREDNGLGTAVTKPTDFCMQKLFLPSEPCMAGWVSFAIRFQSKSRTLHLLFYRSPLLLVARYVVYHSNCKQVH